MSLEMNNESTQQSQNNSVNVKLQSISEKSNVNLTSVSNNKRRKISIACYECRIHKTKCDGVHPICGSCQKRKLPENACEYSPERGKRGVKNQYVQLLEDKVKELEMAMNKQKQATPNSSHIISLPSLTSAIAIQQSTQVSLSTVSQNHLTIPSSPLDNVPYSQNQNVSSPLSHNSGDHTNSIASAASTFMDKPPITNNELTIPESSWTPRRDSQNSPLISNQRRSSDVGINKDQDQSGIDAMGAVTTEKVNNSKVGSDHQGYFGSSSAGRFMKQIHQVIDKKTSSTSLFSESSGQGSPNSTSSLSKGSVQRRFSTDLISDIALPPRRIADELVESYWTYVHTLYPFLHKPSFMKTYYQLWGYPATDHSYNESETVDDNETFDLYESESEPLFQCTLNLVFALGCQLSPDTNENERETASDLFFQRSKKLLHFDLLESGNIKVVQALLLMGQYLQCTKLPGRCWLVVGLAIRVAQGIGLHLEKKYTSKNYNQLERELQRRLWGGCIVLDRVISMAYGRPFMIPIARDLKLPHAIDDEILTAFPKPPAIQPEKQPSRMSFLVHTIQLYEIMGEILLTLYSEADGFGSTSEASARSEIDEQNLATSLNSILKLESALDRWKLGLPSILSYGSNYNSIYSLVNDEKEARLLFRQSNVLKARYLHICILLYRPLLVFYFTIEESNQPGSENCNITDLQKSLLVQSSKKCVTVAQNLIRTISHNIKAQLPAWWYSVFYLYTAATVLLMARLFPNVRDLIGQESLLQSWNECLNCMSEYQEHGSARNCYRYFSELDKHIWATKHEQANNSAMSSIQILGTLPQYNNYIPQQVNNTFQNDNINYNNTNPAKGLSEDFNFNNANSALDNTVWDFDIMQNVSWLGRLPVYTDIESEYQSLNNNWGSISFL